MGNPNCCFMIIAGNFFFSSQSPRGTVSWIQQVRLTQFGRAYSQSQLYIPLGKNQNKENVILVTLSLWKVENSKFVHVWQISWIQWKRILFILLIYEDWKKWHNEVKKFFWDENSYRRRWDFSFLFLSIFLSIYRRSQVEIALNQTLIYSASTVFIQQLTSSSYRKQLQVKNDLIWTKKSKLGIFEIP